MQSSEKGNGKRENLFICEILKSESAPHLFINSAIEDVYEKLNKKKKRDRYVAKVLPTQIAFESIEKAKKRYPIQLAEISDIGRIPADPNVFSLQVQKGKKNKAKKSEDKKADGGPVQLYLIRFEDSAAVDTFFDAVNANKANSTALGAPPSVTESLTGGQNTVTTTRNEADEEGSLGGGSRTANTEDSSVGTQKKQKKKDKAKKKTRKEKKNKKAKAENDTSKAASRDSYQNEMALGETASNDAGGPAAEAQLSYLGFAGSEPDIRLSRPNNEAFPGRHDDGRVNELPAVLQKGNRTGCKETFIEYQPPVGSYRVAPTRKSRMEVDAWPPWVYSQRRASEGPFRSESSESSHSSEHTLSCSVTPTYRNVDRGQTYWGSQRRSRRGMDKSYRCRDQDSIFYGARMSPQSQMLDQLVRQTFALRYDD